jgi:hypothetical protein
MENRMDKRASIKVTAAILAKPRTPYRLRTKIDSKVRMNQLPQTRELVARPGFGTAVLRRNLLSEICHAT